MPNDIQPSSDPPVRSSEIVSLVEQAIGCLTEAGTGKQYDSSWIRPRTMTRQEMQTACEQAYHWMHKVKESLEAAPPPEGGGGCSRAAPCSASYPLFKHMSDTYQLTLIEDELQEIIAKADESRWTRPNAELSDSRPKQPTT